MKVIIKNVRMSFNDLFDPKLVGDSKEPKFSITGICLDGGEEGNPDNFVTEIVYTNAKGEKVTAPYDKLSDLIDHVAKEKFGKVPPKLVNWAFNKADGSTSRDEYVDKEGEYYEGFSEDTYYISAAKQAKMVKDGVLTVLDQLREPIAPNSGKIFSGCFVNLVVDLYAMAGKNGSKDSVQASLEGVQLKKKGAALGFTQIDAADDFDEEEIEDAGADDLL